MTLMTSSPEAPPAVELLRGPRDALLIVDAQRDFLPGGALGVPDGDAVVPVLNRYITEAKRRGAPVFASRDWHPPNHCSFRQQGGRWPGHCIAGSEGAQFAPDLRLPSDVRVVDKATTAEAESYSAFGGTALRETLRALGIERLVIGGLATDYCVLSTVRDALREGYEVFVVEDAVRAVDARPGDGDKALAEMRGAGARLVRGPAGC
jgi:nicotinamidase/pyrazinamidase